MKVLVVTAQKPDSTGSGVYVAETLAGMLESGQNVALIAGIDADDTPTLPSGTRFIPVHFNTPELPFPVCGMSDEMPYEATRYRDLTPTMTASFIRAFERALEEACAQCGTITASLTATTAVTPEAKTAKSAAKPAAIPPETEATQAESALPKTATTWWPDVVICHHLYLACAVVTHWFETHSTVACPLPRIAAVCHSTDIRQMRTHHLKRNFIMRGVGLLHRIFALHDAQAQEIAELYDIKREQITVVGAGYNANLFTRNARTDTAAHLPVRICYAGKIWRKKGVASLLSCLQLLPFSSNELEFVLAGGYNSPEEFEYMRTRAAQAPYPVHFPGKLTQEKLAELYRSSRVFVLPSFYEGLPLVVLEALACGCRVVVTDLPGIRPWIHKNIPHAPVNFVAPPHMICVDEPDESTLPAFEAHLAEALEWVIRAEQPAPYTTAGLENLSWKALSMRLVEEA